MSDPFRSDLEAARGRIEQLEAEHDRRVGELEEENRRLRARLIDEQLAAGSRRQRPRHKGLARVVLPVAMLLFGAALGGGMVVGRRTRPAMDAPLPGPIQAQELAEPSPVELDFDRRAAVEALDGVRIQDCALPTGPTGVGRVKITFAPSGAVVKSEIEQGGYAHTLVGDCIADRYRGARVRPFSGAPVTVAKSFSLE